VAPRKVSEDVWTRVAAGGNHTCAIREDRTLWCWGRNRYGQLGDGTGVDRAVPTQIGDVATWETVATGYAHTCATRTDHTLWCWGDNSSGQVGDGSTTDRFSPVQVGASQSWATAAAGGKDSTHSHSCALTTGKTLWCWGYNESGQLGVNDNQKHKRPTQVGSQAD